MPQGADVAFRAATLRGHVVDVARKLGAEARRAVASRAPRGVVPGAWEPPAPAADAGARSAHAGSDAATSGAGGATAPAAAAPDAGAALTREYVASVAAAAGLAHAPSPAAASPLDSAPPRVPSSLWSPFVASAPPASAASSSGSSASGAASSPSGAASASSGPVAPSVVAASPSSAGVVVPPSAATAPPQLPAGGGGADEPSFSSSSSSSPSSASESAAPAAAPAAPRAKRVFREVAVPASPLARVWGFGSLAASMALGAAGEAASRTLGLGGGAGGAGGGAGAGYNPPGGMGVPLSEAQAERLAEGLCRMRGAALKIGQMLSLSDESMIPPSVAAVLERVRTQADVMPRRQLEAQMAAELGPDWRARLGGPAFEDAPVAAASIGQVHRSTLPDGRVVAIKVQYPGVAESIGSDLANLKRLLSVFTFLPKGLYVDSLIEVAREELTAECDYEREAECQERFRALVGDDADFAVPAVVRELSTRRVLVTTWLPGVPIDAAVDAGLGQAGRDRIARKLLKLTLKELFEWRFMQTDPNWGNFFYDAATDKIGLLDFGATRSFRKAFVDDYLRLVWAAANNDRETIVTVSRRVGFLTAEGLESKAMVAAHVESGLVVGEPFRTRAPFDFKASGITARVGQHGQTFAEQRLTAPPTEVYSLHRKLAGAFLICIRMGAVIECRDMLERIYGAYVWGEETEGARLAETAASEAAAAVPPAAPRAPAVVAAA